VKTSERGRNPANPSGWTWTRRLGMAGLALATLSAGAVGVGSAGESTPTPITISFNTPAAGAKTPTPRPLMRPTQTPSPANTPTTEPTATPESTPVDLEFAADDWEGGFYQGSGAAYAREWTAVYGAQSQYPAGILSFELEDEPTGEVVFRVEGLDDEFEGQHQIALEINDRRVYEGGSPFASFGGNFDNPEWTRVVIRIPEGLLEDGENEIAFLSLEPSAATGQPPYFLLSVASLRSADADDEATETPAIVPQGGDEEIQIEPSGDDDSGDDDGGDDDGDGGNGSGGDDDGEGDDD